MILLAGSRARARRPPPRSPRSSRARTPRSPALIAADLQRLAAIDQLEQLGKQIQIPAYREDTKDPGVAHAQGAPACAGGRPRCHHRHGRPGLHVDEALMEELAAVRKEGEADERPVALDAMTGQEAVNVAEAFTGAGIAFDGVVITKLDGDARGGARSRSRRHGQADQVDVRRREGRPARVVPPDRMASRILGMGDVLSLIERAEEGHGDEQEAWRTAARGAVHPGRLPAGAEDARTSGQPRPAQGRQRRRAASRPSPMTSQSDPHPIAYEADREGLRTLVK